MTSSTDPAARRWRAIASVLALALAATLGSAVTVIAQDGDRHATATPEATTTTDRVTEPDASVEDLDPDAVQELGGEAAAAAQLAASAATDGRFSSGVGAYVARSSQCVLFDTRSEAKLAPGSTTTFALTGNANVGGESGCNVPSGALSAHVNVVAIGPDSAGNLKMFGASLTTEPNGGIVNFQSLDPNLNNSNAFVMDNDGDGWKVKVNGGGVHVRAVLMGWFVDGGSSYASASHDHGVVQATGGAVHVETTDPNDLTVVRTVDMDIPDECAAFLAERHRVLVTYSGYLFPHTGSSDADVLLWVNGSQEGAAAMTFADDDAGGVNQTPLAKTYLVEDLPAGTNTFEVRAKVGSESAAVDIDADLVVEHRGWTCGFSLPTDGE